MKVMSRSTTNSKVKLPLSATATHVVAAQMMSPGKVPFRDENAEEMKRSAARRGGLVKTSSLFVQVMMMMMMTIDDDDDDDG